MSNTTLNKNGINKSVIILISAVILFFVLLYTLPFDRNANSGLALLALIAVLWLTEALHVTITALMVPLLAIFLGLVNTSTALATFADPNIFLFFGGFALATALHIQQLDKMIANKIMALAKGKLSVAIMYLFSVTAFLSMWVSNTATAAMMLPLAMGVLSRLDRNAEHNTYVFVLLGIAYSASIGGMGTLVGSPPNNIVATQLHLTFADWLWYGLPIMLVLMPLMIGTLYIVFKPKLNVRFEQEFEKVEMNKSRWITLGIFVFIALSWVFSSQINPILSGLLGLTGKIGSFDSVIALAAAVIICITGVANWKQIQDNTDWGVLMLFGGGLTLSIVLKDTGASKILADGIVAFVGNKHWLIMTSIMATFIVFLTEFTSNTASAALMLPIFISVANSLGLPPISLAAIIACGASAAFMLPIATPPNAIVFATGYIKQSEMVRVGLLLNLLCIIILGSLSYFFWIHW